MFQVANNSAASLTTSILFRTQGFTHGPITRLVSPGDLGKYIKPFVFLDSFDADAGRPVPMGYHPHSGIVTVTTIFEGSLTYEDSTNKSGKLTAGTVEWMHAGSGVWHAGMPVEAPGTRIKGFQLWLALPESLENSAPESLYIEPEQILRSGPARVIIGEYQGVSSPLPNIAPIVYLHVQLQDGERWTFDTPNNYDVLWLAINEGSLTVAGESLANEVAVFEANGEPLTVQAHGNVNFVLGSAVKHPYPLITGSYSVHTTEEALRVGEAGIVKVGKRLHAEGRI